MLSELLADQRVRPKTETQIPDVLTKLRDDFINAELRRIRLRLPFPDLSAEENKALLSRQKELQMAKLKPLTPRGPDVEPF